MTFAVVTLSHAGDLARCELLSETIDEFVPAEVNHYVVVDARDSRTFSHMNAGRRRVILVEDVLPWWIMRAPKAHRWWLSLKSVPVRNWFLQQLVKLSLANVVDDKVLIFADADVAFIRPLDPTAWIREDRVRLFRVPGANPETQVKWHRTAGQLLGLGAQDYFGASYIGNLIPWRRDKVLRLQEHISKQAGTGWLEAVCRHWHLSEYILYGVFVDKVLGLEASGHYYDPAKYCHNYWGTDELSIDELREFVRDVNEDDVAVMISSKAGIAPDFYRALLKELWQRPE